MAKIEYFDIGVDDKERAEKFYSELFGWSVKPFGDMDDYFVIEGTGLNAGMMVRKGSPAGVTNYVTVDSVDESSKKVEELGGKVTMAKTAVPGMGWFAIFMDTENNVMALWENDENAK